MPLQKNPQPIQNEGVCLPMYAVTQESSVTHLDVFHIKYGNMLFFILKFLLPHSALQITPKFVLKVTINGKIF